MSASKSTQFLKSFECLSEEESITGSIAEPTETEEEIAEELWEAAKAAMKANVHDFKALENEGKNAIKLIKLLGKPLGKPLAGGVDISHTANESLVNGGCFLKGLKGLCYVLSDILNHASAAGASLFGDAGLTKSVAPYVGKDGNGFLFSTTFLF